MVFFLLYLSVFLSMTLAYLLGSVNCAMIVSRFYRKDIREHGSKNAGMTNVLRTFGKIPALLTLLGDFSKGIVAILVARLLITYLGGYQDFLLGEEVVGFFALLGHAFPIFYDFRGGKGILVSAGIILMINPWVFLSIFAVFLVLFGITRMVSVGSVAATAAFPLAMVVIYLLQGYPIFSVLMNALVALAYAVLVLYLHRDNLKRIWAGEEPKIGRKKED